MIARDVGCSSKSIEQHIKELANKKIIVVSQSSMKWRTGTGQRFMPGNKALRGPLSKAGR
jgi:hypothetical protein